MKRVINLFFLAVATFAIVACNAGSIDTDKGEQMPDPGPEVEADAAIELSKSIIEIGGSKFDAGEATVISNQTVFVASSAETWVRPEIEGKILRVIAVEANDTGAERTSVITVVAGKDDNTATATLSVRQGIRDESLEKTVLTVANPNAELAAQANSVAEVAFETNKSSMTLSVPDEAKVWLDAKIEGDKVIFTALTDNSTAEVHKTVVVLSAGTGDDIVSVGINVTQALMVPEGFSVGALYENGVIFEVNMEEGSGEVQYVKIMSLTAGRGKFSTETESIGTESNPAEGYENTQKIKSMPNYPDAYPACRWCVELGEGWYLPSRAELNAISTAFAAVGFDQINNFIASYGGEELEAGTYHHTSCERDASKSWVVRLSDKNAGNFSKTGSERPVRAVKKIVLAK